MFNKGYADVLIGLQYGDEGKARVVDNIAHNYDIIARFNGGANAGHTVETSKGKLALNQVPSGVFYRDKILYMGSGCVINPEKLVAEIKGIEALDINLEGRFHIAGQASVVQPHHILIDGITGGKIGTTRNGIGPCYADRANRMDGSRLLHIRMGDLKHDPEYFFPLIAENLRVAAETYNFGDIDQVEIIQKMKTSFASISQYVENDPLFLQRLVESGKKVLFEGAQSVMLDVMKGCVPYVTSSHTVAGAAYVGGDLSPAFHRKTIGIVKAVMSRVGNGPFPSEFGGEASEEYCISLNEDGTPKHGKHFEAQLNLNEMLYSHHPFEVGKGLRVLSKEYGTVTTRPRRIGILDLPQLNYAIRLNGVTDLVINKCDVLREYSGTRNNKLPLVKSYEFRGESINYIPSSTMAYRECKAEIENYETFDEDLTTMRSKEELPENLKIFLNAIEQTTGTSVVAIGVGPDREQFITLKDF